MLLTRQEASRVVRILVIAFDPLELADPRNGFIGLAALAFGLHSGGFDEASAHVRPAGQVLDAVSFRQRVIPVVAIGHQITLITLKQTHRYLPTAARIVVVRTTGLSGGPPVWTHPRGSRPSVPRRSPPPTDVSGRSAFRANLRHPTLLVSQTDSTAMPGHGNSGISYAYAAVSVSDGQLDTLILPYVNGHCMQLFLDEVASRHPNDRIVMVLDGAGWHQSDSLSLAPNLRLLKLPPYSLELNPVEHLGDDLREKSFHHRVFDSIDALEEHLEVALRDMKLDHHRVHSIVAWPWIITSLKN